MIGPLSIVGPVGVRKGHLKKVCDVSVGHEHNYDHATFVIRGRLKVFYSWTEDGRTIEGESREFGQGDIIDIKANVRHTLKALEEDTLYHCVFSHRDFDGMVSQTYVGNDKAYDAKVQVA